jgi:hypothetical protein
VSVAHHIRANALGEPRVAEFSPRGGGLPGIFVGIGQRTENHFGQRIHVGEQSLLACAHAPNLFRIPFERSGDSLFGFVERCIYTAQLLLDRCPQDEACQLPSGRRRGFGDPRGVSRWAGCQNTQCLKSQIFTFAKAGAAINK